MRGSSAFSAGGVNREEGRAGKLSVFQRRLLAAGSSSRRVLLRSSLFLGLFPREEVCWGSGLEKRGAGGGRSALAHSAPGSSAGRGAGGGGSSGSSEEAPLPEALRPFDARSVQHWAAGSSSSSSSDEENEEGGDEEDEEEEDGLAGELQGARWGSRVLSGEAEGSLPGSSAPSGAGAFRAASEEEEEEEEGEGEAQDLEQGDGEEEEDSFSRQQQQQQQQQAADAAEELAEEAELQSGSLHRGRRRGLSRRWRPQAEQTAAAAAEGAEGEVGLSSGAEQRQGRQDTSFWRRKRLRSRALQNEAIARLGLGGVQVIPLGEELEEEEAAAAASALPSSSSSLSEQSVRSSDPEIRALERAFGKGSAPLPKELMELVTAASMLGGPRLRSSVLSQESSACPPLLSGSQSLLQREHRLSTFLHCGEEHTEEEEEEWLSFAEAAVAGAGRRRGGGAGQ